MKIKRQNQKLLPIKLTFALLTLILVSSAFTSGNNSDRNYIGKSNSKIAGDTIKKINVPIEYLKLLEGEYISTNEPKPRKIKFEEIDGALFGNDNGYVYMLIPVGEEKFINPDDGATLVFNTKNKKAITLLLFGTIQLKKVK